MPAFVRSVRLLWDELPDESAMTIQGENEFPIDRIPEIEAYDCLKYGRNLFLICIEDEDVGTCGQSDESEHNTDGVDDAASND